MLGHRAGGAHDTPAAFEQRLGDAQADSAGSAGDDGDSLPSSNVFLVELRVVYHGERSIEGIGLTVDASREGFVRNPGDRFDPTA